MKGDLNNLKKLVHEIIDKGDNIEHLKNAEGLIHNVDRSTQYFSSGAMQANSITKVEDQDIEDTEEFIEESLSLEEKEIELIKKALEKHNGKRKYAAQELGISERTLYRKIKEYNIN